MKASDKLIAYIRKAEGCRLAAYQDVAGVWTIGFGHTKGVKAGDRITQYQADQWLREDLAVFEAVANRCKRIDTQGKFDAVLDFIYNCGPEKFDKSTLKRYIEAGRKTADIQREFLKWVNSGGRPLDGLYSRRIWEAARFAE
ncbi:MAG: lysozyme [Bacteroidaceae bacterium]|nr:lysozyme [Bacteroidaceae bacterium]